MGRSVRTGAEVTRSSKTRYMMTLPRGAKVYEHQMRGVYGRYVVVENKTDWHAHQTLDDAIRSVV